MAAPPSERLAPQAVSSDPASRPPTPEGMARERMTTYLVSRGSAARIPHEHWDGGRWSTAGQPKRRPG